MHWLGSTAFQVCWSQLLVPSPLPSPLPIAVAVALCSMQLKGVVPHQHIFLKLRIARLPLLLFKRTNQKLRYLRSRHSTRPSTVSQENDVDFDSQSICLSSSSSGIMPVFILKTCYLRCYVVYCRWYTNGFFHRSHEDPPARSCEKGPVNPMLFSRMMKTILNCDHHLNIHLATAME